MKSPLSTEPELAGGWSINRVRHALDCADKVSLTTFLTKRYEERFFEPIQRLRSSPGHFHGYGFAIMALCSLLVESLQCYRDGLPTTHEGEYRGLSEVIAEGCTIAANGRNDSDYNDNTALMWWFDQGDPKLAHIGLPHWIQLNSAHP